MSFCRYCHLFVILEASALADLPTAEGCVGCGGRVVSRCPTREWAGVSGDSSPQSEWRYVSGLELMTASTSVSNVCSSSKDRKALPITFHRQTLTDRIRCSHMPPCQAAHSTIYLHMIFLSEKKSCSFLSIKVHIICKFLSARLWSLHCLNKLLRKFLVWQ